MKRLFIIGGQSTALEIRETIELCNHTFDEILNVVSDEEECMYSYIQDKDLLSLIDLTDDIFYIIGFTNIKLKKRYIEIFTEKGGSLYNVIHPNAYVAKSAKLGGGIYIAAFSDVSTNAIIGDNCLINYQVTIGHDAVIGNNCTFNPGAKIGGHAIIEENCLLGANSFVLQGLHIAHDTKVDALTYVKNHIIVPSVCKSKSEFIIVRNLFVKP